MLNNVDQWTAAYQGNGRAHKNRYPSERVVGWVLRNYKPGARALDVGCGWGNNLRFLLAEGFDAEGIDFASSAIDSLKSEFGARVRCEGARQTSFSDGEFDFIIDRCSIQHNPSEDLPAIFAEMQRVLRPGGRFYSELRHVGDDGFQFAGPSMGQLREALAGFSQVHIDLMNRTEENQTRRFESYLIDATK